MTCRLTSAKSLSIWTSAGIMLIGPLGIKFSEIFIEIYTFSFKKMHFKMSFGKWRPFCLGLNVLIPQIWHWCKSCDKAVCGPFRVFSHCRSLTPYRITTAHMKILPFQFRCTDVSFGSQMTHPDWRLSDVRVLCSWSLVYWHNWNSTIPWYHTTLDW